MKSILDILRIDYRSYDDYRFSCYFSWCSLYTEFGSPLQALTTSKPLYDWYCQQWFGVVETAFKDDYKSYIEANVTASNRYLDLLATYPKAIEAYYPKVILDMIKNELKPQKKNENVH